MNASPRLLLWAAVLWVAMLPPLAQAAPDPADASSVVYRRAYPHTRLDAAAPYPDPLSTRPEGLDRPLRWSLPPELQAAAPLAADGMDCATADQAADLSNPQRALLALPPASHGQALTLTLALAAQLALCHSAQVRASWSQIAQQAAALGQARSSWLPQLTASASRQQGRYAYPATPFLDSTTYATAGNIGLNWRLWDFGARDARTDAAQRQLQAAVASQNATVLKALGDLLQTYTDAQIAQARVQTQQALLPLMQRSLQTAQRRQKEGAGSAGDTLQALSTLARTQLETSRAQGDLGKALAQLNFALGLPAEARYQLPPPELPTDERQSQAQRQWIDQALEDASRPDALDAQPAIVAAKAQWQAAQAQILATQADGLPTLEASYSYFHNGRPNQGISSQSSRETAAAITLTVPLFDGFNSTYKVRNAQAIAEQKAIEYQGAQQQALQDIAQSHAEARAAWRNLEAAHALLAAATEAAASVQRQYHGGATDILQLNQSLSSLQQAQHEDTRAQAEWLRAKVRLLLLATPQARQ